MPLHRHECESCGHQFRILVDRGAQNDTPTCPACGSTRSHRMLPLVAVHFKGSGYYKTDHGRRGSRPDKGGEGIASQDSGESKSEGDPSTTSEKKTSGDAKTGKKPSDSAAPGTSKSSSHE